MKRLISVALIVLVCMIGEVGVSSVAAQSDRQVLQELHRIEQSLSSLQSAVERIPPSWSQKLPAAERFELVLDGVAVLDKETGLVWEKSPSAGVTHFFWQLALEHCSALTTGNRMGWRLPALSELASLVDPLVPPPGPTLPSEHPFVNVQTGGYWSATTHAMDNTLVRVVSFYDGQVVNGLKSGGYGYVWCVRGGQGADAQ